MASNNVEYVPVAATVEQDVSVEAPEVQAVDVAEQQPAEEPAQETASVNLGAGQSDGTCSGNTCSADGAGDDCCPQHTKRPTPPPACKPPQPPKCPTPPKCPSPAPKCSTPPKPARCPSPPKCASPRRCSTPPSPKCKSPSPPPSPKCKSPSPPPSPKCQSPPTCKPSPPCCNDGSADRKSAYGYDKTEAYGAQQAYSLPDNASYDKADYDYKKDGYEYSGSKTNEDGSSADDKKTSN